MIVTNMSRNEIVRWSWTGRGVRWFLRGKPASRRDVALEFGIAFVEQSEKNMRREVSLRGRGDN